MKLEDGLHPRDCQCHECWLRRARYEQACRIIDRPLLLPFLMAVDFASGPDKTVVSFRRQLQEDVARACGVPAWEMALTDGDRRFLQTIKIDPER